MHGRTSCLFAKTQFFPVGPSMGKALGSVQDNSCLDNVYNILLYDKCVIFKGGWQPYFGGRSNPRIQPR
jgi:hypothetical protein